jgi:hypothetical protein
MAAERTKKQAPNDKQIPETNIHYSNVWMLKFRI